MLHWKSLGQDVVIAPEHGSNREFGLGTIWEVCEGHCLVFQHDGNLVLYYETKPVWATGTNLKTGQVLAVQIDGNVVLYGRNGRVGWATNVVGAGHCLVIRTDGNMVVRDREGEVRWATGTTDGRVGDLAAATSFAAVAKA